MKYLIILIASLLAISFTSCSDDEDANIGEVGDIASNVPDVYKKFSNVTEVYLEGDFVVIKCSGVPDHKSCYYEGTAWEDDYYEAYNGSNTSFNQNPNTIETQNYTFKIPSSPAKASTHEATPMGPIGVALNGCAIYNQYAAPGDDLTEEINTFDQYQGHPTGTGSYHYHMEPTYLTGSNGLEALVGFLLDGFPVYGPKENGAYVSNSDLDAYHGHTSATADYPDGIYHYHITSSDPYINGDGYYGTSGTVSN